MTTILANTCKVHLCGAVLETEYLCLAHAQRLANLHTPARRPPQARGTGPEYVFYRSILYNPFGGCWLWFGSFGQKGYGQLSVRRADGRKTTVRAHRYAYELLIGPIPEGLELDHLCRVRHCVNPLHLEPVTHAENVRRARDYWRSLELAARR